MAKPWIHLLQNKDVKIISTQQLHKAYKSTANERVGKSTLYYAII